MNKVVIQSYAKVNLYLKLLNKRKDNYHNLKTIFERISLCDRIILTRRKDLQIKVISGSPDIPKDSSNLVFKSAKLLQDELRLDQGVNIRIIKHIPVGGGLGGGSSNAASVLLGLNKLWGLNLTQKRLAGFAAKIGSDAAFFIYNTPFALGTCRGEKITPIRPLSRKRFWHVLAVCKTQVSTPLIYAAWDRLRAGKPRLTTAKSNAKLLISALKKSDIGLIQKGLFNDLEPVTFGLYPEVFQVKESFYNLGVKPVLMSGSGAAVFAITSSRFQAVSLCKELKRRKGLRVFIARTV